MVKILYKGPKTFEDFVRSHYDAALQSLPLQFKPSIDTVVQVTFDYDRQTFYAQPSGNENFRVAFGVPPNYTYPDVFQIMGFKSKPTLVVGNHVKKTNGNGNAQSQFDEAVDEIVKNYSEDQRLEASRALRRLCGPEALKAIAEGIDEALSATGFPKNYNPYLMALTPAFWNECFGIDCVVRTSTFHDTEIYTKFSPNFIAETMFPGLLAGNLPPNIGTCEEYINHISGFLRERGIGPNEYSKYLAMTLHRLLRHGLAHNRLVADSEPYREFSDFYQGFVGKEVSLEQFRTLGERYAGLTKRIGELDLDVLNEAFASIAQPNAGCFTLEEKIRKAGEATSILKTKPGLAGQIQDIITYAWTKNRNAFEILQKET